MRAEDCKLVPEAAFPATKVHADYEVRNSRSNSIRSSPRSRWALINKADGVDNPIRLTSHRLDIRVLRPFKLSRKLNQAPYRYSRWPFSDPGFVVVHPCGARDIEVNPRSLFGKFLEKRGSGRSATPASTTVLQIGNRGAHGFEIFVAKRQPPHLFTGFADCFGKFLIHLVIARKDSCIYISKRNNYSSGERGGIDQMGAAELPRVTKTVR